MNFEEIIFANSGEEDVEKSVENVRLWIEKRIDSLNIKRVEILHEMCASEFDSNIGQILDKVLKLDDNLKFEFLLKVLCHFSAFALKNIRKKMDEILQIQQISLEGLYFILYFELILKIDF